MDKPRNLWSKLCSYENLELAFKFEKNLKENLTLLRTELLLHSYAPEPLKTFIVRDPKMKN